MDHEYAQIVVLIAAVMLGLILGKMIQLFLKE